jgi:hypothetical protein
VPRRESSREAEEGKVVDELQSTRVLKCMRDQRVKSLIYVCSSVLLMVFFRLLQELAALQTPRAPVVCSHGFQRIRTD